MVFMLDCHLLKNAFSEEGIFFNANYSGKYYLSPLYNGHFLVQTDTTVTPISTSLLWLLTSVHKGCHFSRSQHKSF